MHVQQRTMSTIRGVDDDECIIGIGPMPYSDSDSQAKKHSPGRRSIADSRTLLPLYRKRDHLRNRLADKWIHAIPVFLFLVFCILWWFSYPVKVLIKDGTEFPQPLSNYSHIELAIIGASPTTLQFASVPLNLTANTSDFGNLQSMPTISLVDTGN